MALQQHKTFKVGDKVRIYGLRHKGNYNGCVGTVIGDLTDFVKTAARYPVQIKEDNASLLVKPTNMKLHQTAEEKKKRQQEARRKYRESDKGKQSNLTYRQKQKAKQEQKEKDMYPQAVVDKTDPNFDWNAHNHAIKYGYFDYTNATEFLTDEQITKYRTKDIGVSMMSILLMNEQGWKGFKVSFCLAVS
eukprot:1032250_1